MATYNVTGPGGTAGHPSKLSAGIRTPYLVENTIDVSAVNGDSGAAQNDILQAIDVPAETLVMNVGLEVLTALSSSVTLDVGDGDTGDIYVDGDTNATGYAAQHNDVANVGKTYGSADTIDVKVLDAASSAGKIRVWAVMCDISGVDEEDRNTDTQHDTAV